MTSYKMPELPQGYRFTVRHDQSYFKSATETDKKQEISIEEYEEFYFGAKNVPVEHEPNGLLSVSVQYSDTHEFKGKHVKKRIWGFLWNETRFDPDATYTEVYWHTAALSGKPITALKVQPDEASIAVAATSLVESVAAHQEQQRKEVETERLLDQFVGTYPPKELDNLGKSE